MQERSKREEKRAKMDMSIRCEGHSCNLLAIGSPVYVISDEPTDITGIKLAENIVLRI